MVPGDPFGTILKKDSLYKIIHQAKYCKNLNIGSGYIFENFSCTIGS